MLDKTDSNLLQRKIIIYSVSGILLISTVIAVVSIVPLYKQLISEQEKNLVFSVATKIMAVEEFLARSKNVASQIASRTRVRQKLEEYNEKIISLEGLLPFNKKALGDALKSSNEVHGITQLDKKGEVVIQLGVAVKEKYWPKKMFESNEIIIKGPVNIGNESYLVIAAPIVGGGVKRVGTDIIIYEIKQLRRIITD